MFLFVVRAWPSSGMTLEVQLSSTSAATGGCLLSKDVSNTALSVASDGSSITVTLADDSTTMSMRGIHVVCSTATPVDTDGTTSTGATVTATVVTSNGNTVLPFAAIALTAYDVPTAPADVRYECVISVYNSQTRMCYL